MKYKKLKQEISESRLIERTTASVEKQQAMLEYVLVMVDIELPEDEAESEVTGDE